MSSGRWAASQSTFRVLSPGATPAIKKHNGFAFPSYTGVLASSRTHLLRQKLPEKKKMLVLSKSVVSNSEADGCFSHIPRTQHQVDISKITF